MCTAPCWPLGLEVFTASAIAIGRPRAFKGNTIIWLKALENLIDICIDYSNDWRFKFGINKSKTVVIVKKDMYKPTWYIGNNKLDRISEVELLGVTIDTKGGYDTHF